MRARILGVAVVGLAVAAPLAGQGFGQTVLAAGDEVLVGESLYATRPGYVYVLRKNGSGQWVEASRFQASDAEPNDHFGRTLVLADGDLLVGSTISRESGALYVFRRTGGEWREVQSLVASDAKPDHSFGREAATDGRTVLMADWAADASRGAVYVFEKRDGNWQETAKLSASDAVDNDWFGYSMAIAGDRIAVGARNRDSNRGRVFLFSRSGGGWTESGTLVAPDTSANLQFGAGMAFADEALIVGAPGADGFVGAAYVFRPEGRGMAFDRKITPPAGTQPTNSFGEVITNAGDAVWVSAAGMEGGSIFPLTPGSWTLGAALKAREADPGDGVGGALSIDGDLAVAGAIGDDFGYGSVVIFERDGTRWNETGRVASEIEGLDPITGDRVTCADHAAAGFGCEGVDILSFLPVSAIGGGRGVSVNDVWGWTDSGTGKEWALVGRYDGTSFIDISDPSHPVVVADLPLTDGAQPNSWRDIKVYRDHAYIVADGAGQHGMQVFDLTRLRNLPAAATPTTVEPDLVYDRIASAHNIVINEETGFAYAVGASSGGETCGGALHMIDIREPKNPTFAGCFQDTETGNQRTGYSHDAQCVTYAGPDEAYRGHEICFGSNETALSIADVSEKGQPKAISRAAYPNVGYAHQGWLDEQHEYFYMNDEGDETSGTVPFTRTLVWDVKDLDDPVLVKEYFGTSRSSDHNLYVVGDLMYQSNYVSGLRIVDISNRGEPHEVGYFDTVPASDDPGFDGSWSNYPFFASGTIVVTSGREGVFFLRRQSRPIS